MTTGHDLSCENWYRINPAKWHRIESIQEIIVIKLYLAIINGFIINSFQVNGLIELSGSNFASIPLSLIK